MKNLRLHRLMMHYDRNILKRTFTDLSLIVQYFYKFDILATIEKTSYICAAVKVNEQTNNEKLQFNDAL